MCSLLNPNEVSIPRTPSIVPNSSARMAVPSKYYKRGHFLIFMSKIVSERNGMGGRGLRPSGSGKEQFATSADQDIIAAVLHRFIGYQFDLFMIFCSAIFR
jgi:hypothetical protein